MASSQGEAMSYLDELFTGYQQGLTRGRSLLMQTLRAARAGPEIRSDVAPCWDCRLSHWPPGLQSLQHE
jgi:hypothetical protein